MIFLKQDTTSKGRVEKILELDASSEGSKKYKVEVIWDSVVYERELEGHLPRLYYLLA